MPAELRGTNRRRNATRASSQYKDIKMRISHGAHLFHKLSKAHIGGCLG
jgi:hypothetical protein